LSNQLGPAGHAIPVEPLPAIPAVRNWRSKPPGQTEGTNTVARMTRAAANRNNSKQLIIGMQLNVFIYGR
jgi:hypothetical protein